MANEVPSLLSSKTGVKYSAAYGIEAMRTIAVAARKRSLEEFQAVVKQHESSLRSDALISHQLDELYQKMLESNLLKIIHPYRYCCCVQTTDKHFALMSCALHSTCFACLVMLKSHTLPSSSTFLNTRCDAGSFCISRFSSNSWHLLFYSYSYLRLLY